MVATQLAASCRSRSFLSDMLFSVCFSPVQGGVDARNLFHNYIMVWVQDMQLNLLELCKAEKVLPLLRHELI